MYPIFPEMCVAGFTNQFLQISISAKDVHFQKFDRGSFEDSVIGSDVFLVSNLMAGQKFLSFGRFAKELKK